jgi:hypothetical protein
MKAKETKLVIIDGCGSELLDAVLATVNYELSGDEAVLVHTDDLDNTTDDSGQVGKVREFLDKSPVPVSKHYEGLILLRR